MNQLRALCTDNPDAVNDMVILTPQTLLPGSESIKMIGSHKLDLMDECVPADADYQDYLFISSNRFARSSVSAADIPVDSKLPPYKVKRSKNPGRPTEQHRDNFSFESSQTLFPSTGNQFHSKVSIVDKTNKSKSSSWYAKEKSPERIHHVQLEVLAGELLRYLLGDTFPKHRYLVSDDQLFVMSKKVEGFCNFNSRSALEEFKANGCKGLLPLLFTCMFLEEADLKPDNFGVDEQRRITKIDNDGTFTSITFSMSGNQIPAYADLKTSLVNQYSFSESDIAHPHSPDHYKPACWPDSLFTSDMIMTEENLNELFYVWAKILTTSTIILQIMDKIIDSGNLKETLREALLFKMNTLSQYLHNHTGFKDYMTRNGDDVMLKIQTELTAFAKSNREYFRDMDLSLLKPTNWSSDKKQENQFQM